MNNFCIFKNFIECIIYYFLLFNLSLNEMFKSQIISGDYSKKKTKQNKKKKKKHHSWCDLRLLSIDRNYAPTGLVVDKGLLCRQ